MIKYVRQASDSSRRLASQTAEDRKSRIGKRIIAIAFSVGSTLLNASVNGATPIVNTSNNGIISTSNSRLLEHSLSKPSDPAQNKDANLLAFGNQSDTLPLTEALPQSSTIPDQSLPAESLAARAGMFNEIRVNSSRVFEFALGGREFQVQERYFARYPRVGYLSGLELKVTFPDFKPYGQDTAYCFQPKNSGPHSSGCFTVEFYIDPPAPAGLMIYDRGKIKGSVETQGHDGFETFHVGPKDGGYDYYRLLRPLNPVVISCINFPDTGGEGVCDDTFDLVPGITVRFRIYKTELAHTIKIQDGLQSLIHSFLKPENSK